jgi:hypothetical protein
MPKPRVVMGYTTQAIDDAVLKLFGRPRPLGDESPPPPPPPAPARLTTAQLHEALTALGVPFNTKELKPALMSRLQDAMDVVDEDERQQTAATAGQGLTLVHVSAQPMLFCSHLLVPPCLIDWGGIMHPTYPTKCAYVEPKSGRV